MSVFDTFFTDPVYLLYKNYVYSYLLRRRAVRAMLGKGRGGILELGCGISPMLEPGKEIAQTDISWQGLSYLKKMLRNGQGVRPVACDAKSLPFLNESFDGVVCSEVLEHIEDDREALREISRIAKRGGELILTCPVHKRLFGFDDKFVGHYRRYEIPELLAELSRQGFRDFQVRPILGSLEKLVMLSATRIFSVLKGKGDSGSSRKGTHILAWLFFPIYLLVSYLLAGLVYLQSRFISVEKSTTVCIRCRKSS